MGLMEQAALTWAREQAEASFDQTCTLRTAGTPVSDDAGGFADPSYGTTTAPCRHSIPSTQEQEVASRLGVTVDATITLPHGTVIQQRDQIVVNDATYEVAGINTRQSYQTAVRVLARRVD